MTEKKFEAQPHYEEAIYDQRVLSVVGQIAVNAQETELKKPIRFSWSKEEEPKPTSRYDVPYVNDVEILETTGRDGEVASGGIGLVAVTTADGRSLAAIQSGYYDHKTGLPLQGRSWSAEFDDIDLAEGFWRRHWKPSFDASNFINAVHELKKHKGNIPRNSIRFQQIGLLRPWYAQQEDELPLLDGFSTSNDSIVGLPKRHIADANFNVGQVYKVPKSVLWGYDAKAPTLETKTCLAAFRSVINTWEDHPTELSKSTFVQWSDGEIAAYPPQIGILPLPLAKKDLAQARPRSVAVA